MAGVKKTGGGGWEERVGRGMEGRKKRELGREGRDVFHFVLFSPSPFCACHASYDARALFR